MYTKETMRLSTIGYLTVTDYDKFIEAYSKITLDKIKYFKNLKDGNAWSELFHKLYGSDKTFNSKISNTHDRYFQIRNDGWYKDTPIENFINDFKPCFNYAVEFEQKFNIIYTNENAGTVFYLITFGKYMFLIFNNPYISVEMLKDYSHQTIAQIKGRIAQDELSSILPIEAANLSINSMNNSIRNKRSDLDKLKQKMDDVKSAKTGELAVLQAEIDAKLAELENKKQHMMAILEEKKAEMLAQMELLENQLFVLESEIYAIRCFLGEVINFTKIKSGIRENADSPIVLFQKIRYLDEEMGKLCSIYDFDGDDLKLFEKFIANNLEGLETFCPSRKCISLVRCTKSNFHRCSTFEFGCMLEAYEAFHGKTIGILIRDGENLYIGWTDEEKVNINEDMFFTPGTKTYYDQRDAEEVSKNVSDKYEIASRYFVFSVLQGILENSDIIKLSGKHNFTRPDDKIIYSAADNWITDNKYGSLAELLEKYSCEDINKIDDEIIVIKGLRPICPRNNWDRNDRGIGYANRTHDVSTKDGEIHKINHILSYEHYYIYYTCNDSISPRQYTSPNGIPYHYRQEITGTLPSAEDIRKMQEKNNFTVVDQGYDYNHEYFISLYKDLAWWKTKEDYKVLPRANFQIFPREYINMTFLNSVWITYIIQNKNIGNLGWSSKGPDVGYAYVIKYLNILRKHLLEREKAESTLINEFMPGESNILNIKDWQVMLSEWKFNNNVHKIGKRAAKQFARFVAQELGL